MIMIQTIWANMPIVLIQPQFILCSKNIQRPAFITVSAMPAFCHWIIKTSSVWTKLNSIYSNANSAFHKIWNLVFYSEKGYKLFKMPSEKRSGEAGIEAG